jgi:hypothetical protein
MRCVGGGRTLAIDCREAVGIACHQASRCDVQIGPLQHAREGHTALPKDEHAGSGVPHSSHTRAKTVAQTDALARTYTYTCIGTPPHAMKGACTAASAALSWAVGTSAKSDRPRSARAHSHQKSMHVACTHTNIHGQTDTQTDRQTEISMTRALLRRSYGRPCEEQKDGIVCAHTAREDLSGCDEAELPAQPTHAAKPRDGRINAHG